MIMAAKRAMIKIFNRKMHDKVTNLFSELKNFPEWKFLLNVSNVVDSLALDLAKIKSRHGLGGWNEMNEKKNDSLDQVKFIRDRDVIIKYLELAGWYWRIQQVQI